jgi:hypothetical protein
MEEKLNALTSRYIAKTLTDLGDISPAFAQSIKKHYRWFESDINLLIQENKETHDDGQGFNK